MAKYEDYVQKYQDGLQNEIDNAAEEAEHRQAENAGDDLPERFRGKSAAEIAHSYAELERKFSQQGNDLGELRRTVDEFMRLQSETTSTQEETPEATPVDLDALYDDTDGTLRRVAKEETREVSDRVAALEAELARERLKARLQAMDSKFENWRETAESPEFVDWVNSSPYRARIAQEARERGDVDAAEALLSMYYDVKGAQAQQRQRRTDEQLRNATLETGGPEVPAEVQTFSRAELMQKRVAAKQGDPDAATWLTKNREAIAIAYEEGHITD